MFSEYTLCKARIRSLESKLFAHPAADQSAVHLAYSRERNKLIEMQAIYIFMAIAALGTVVFMLLCAWSGANLFNGVTTQLEFAMSIVRNAFYWIGFIFLSVFASAWFQVHYSRHFGRGA